MRELKYRAWDTGAKRWSSGAMPVSSGLGLELKPAHSGIIVEQYTGLKDKNGKEIYEGDILGGIWEGGYIGYCEKCKQFQYCSYGGCMACSGDVHWFEIAEDDEKLEVIGNIHENPELLEGK